MDVLARQDMAINGIPEVESAVGKLGRVESSLDPAPISMIETIINYKPEYMVDKDGKRLTFRFDASAPDLYRDVGGRPIPAPDGKPYLVRGRFARDAEGRLVADPAGQPFRQWRPALKTDLNPERAAWPGIRRPDDIWQEPLSCPCSIAGSGRSGWACAAMLRTISNRRLRVAGMNPRVKRYLISCPQNYYNVDIILK